MIKVLVISGKGGSCKTTVASNMAAELAMRGELVGLADLDITGPDVPLALNMEKTETRYKDYKLIRPFIKKLDNGNIIEVMSLDFFTSRSDQPFLMNGEKRSLFVQQFLEKVAWNEDLAFMFYDMPPTAGGEFITIVRGLNNAFDGAVIAAEPSKACLSEVMRTINLCDHLNIPLFGLVSNKGHINCKKCGERNDIFKSDIKRLAERKKVPFLGEVPVIPSADEDALVLNEYFKSIVDNFLKEVSNE